MQKIKYFIGGALALLLLGAGCTATQQPAQTNIESMDQGDHAPESMTENTRGETETMEEAKKQTTQDVVDEIVKQPLKLGEVLKTIEIVAKKWEFTPSTITVNQGDRVKLVIESVDVTHGISIPAFGINENLAPGEITVIDFVADKVGTHSFSCSVFCGSGHGNMTGVIIVE